MTTETKTCRKEDCGVTLVIGENWTESQQRQGHYICCNCHSEEEKGRKRQRYCTIKTPDGVIEDWVRWEHRKGRGTILDTWMQVFPAHLFERPRRADLLRGAFAKTVGTGLRPVTSKNEVGGIEEFMGGLDLPPGLPTRKGEAFPVTRQRSHEDIEDISDNDQVRTATGRTRKDANEKPLFLYATVIDDLLKVGSEVNHPDKYREQRYLSGLSPINPLRREFHYKFIYYVERNGRDLEEHIHAVLAGQGVTFDGYREWFGMASLKYGITLCHRIMAEAMKRPDLFGEVRIKHDHYFTGEEAA